MTPKVYKRSLNGKSARRNRLEKSLERNRSISMKKKPINRDRMSSNELGGQSLNESQTPLNNAQDSSYISQTSNRLEKKVTKIEKEIESEDESSNTTDNEKPFSQDAL